MIKKASSIFDFYSKAEVIIVIIISCPLIIKVNGIKCNNKLWKKYQLLNFVERLNFIRIFWKKNLIIFISDKCYFYSTWSGLTNFNSYKNSTIIFTCCPFKSVGNRVSVVSMPKTLNTQWLRLGLQRVATHPCKLIISRVRILVMVSSRFDNYRGTPAMISSTGAKIQGVS